MTSDPSPAAEPSAWLHAAVERFERPLTAYAWRLLGGGPEQLETARDVVQDTFLRLCRQPRSEVEGHLAAWLFAVCRNRCMDEHRRRKEAPMTAMTATPPEATARPDPAAGMVAADASDRLRSALSTLPEGHQEVIRLKFQQGLSYADIATITGHSVHMVGYLIHTALDKLRGQLTAETI
jgi:RNA polymerase sigma factor (sigma-70 family)